MNWFDQSDDLGIYGSIKPDQSSVSFNFGCLSAC